MSNSKRSAKSTASTPKPKVTPFPEIAGTDCQIGADAYWVRVPKLDALIIKAHAKHGTRGGASFTHPDRLLACVDEVYETKHYRATGSKFWTHGLMRTFYFAIPYQHLGLVDEQGCSYVPIEIGRRPYTLSVSGGTHTTYTPQTKEGLNHGWLDVIPNRPVGLCGDQSSASLRHLAKYALTCSDAIEHSLGFDIHEPQDARWDQLMAQRILHRQLDVGWHIYLKPDTSGDGATQGPYVLLAAPHEKKLQVLLQVIGQARARWSAKFMQIDWVKTAQANGEELPTPLYFNHVGNILPPRS